MELRELQLSELEILREYIRICDDNGLRYFIQAGTLLGAVRHEGFIPWDDDIDLSMPREDYDRLAQLCQKELDSRFFFQNSYSDSNFPFCFSKIRKNGTEVYEESMKNVKMHKGRFIDIFPLDVCPQNEAMARMYFRLVTLTTNAYMAKVDPDFVNPYKNHLTHLMLRVMAHLSIPQIRSLRTWIVKLPMHFKCKGRLCTVGGAHGYPTETYDEEWFSGTEQMAFEDMRLNVPSGWNMILRHMYGDYMKPVAQENRQGHFRET